MGLSLEAQILRVESVIRWHYRDKSRGGDGINDDEVLGHLEGLRGAERVAELREEGEATAANDKDSYVATNRRRRAKAATKKKSGGETWESVSQPDVAVVES